MRIKRSLFPRSAKLLMVPLSVILWMPGALHAQKPAPPATPADQPKVDPVVTQLVDAHNKERAKEGLPPLKLEPKLQEAAKRHAKDMAEHEKMSHEGSDESTPAMRVTDAGYHYLLTGENVARGYREVKDVMESWMESPPHKKNILGEYTEIGVAVAYGKDEKPYWCADFGKPIPKFDPTKAAEDLIKRINEERAAGKLPALVLDPKLTKAAQDQAVSLAKKQSPGGGTATMDGIDRRLYPDTAVSTAAGQPDAESVVKTLKDDPGLKAQILGKYARIGTGYATTENGVPYWCLILANPARR